MRNTRALHETRRRTLPQPAVARRPGLLVPLAPDPAPATSPRVLLVEDEPELAAALSRHLSTLGFETIDAEQPWAPELLPELGRLSGIVTGPWIDEERRLELFVFARRIVPEARRLALVPAHATARAPLAHVTLAPPWSTDALGPALGMAWALAAR